MNFFKKKKKDPEHKPQSINDKGNINLSSNSSILVWNNDFVNLVHEATKICWDKPPAKTYEDKLKYIAKRIHDGHESVLEHSNVVMVISLSYDNMDSFYEVCGHLHYLNFKVIKNDEDKCCNILLGGSIRGYKFLIQNSLRNPFVNLVISSLYECCTREFFLDFIEKGIIDDNFSTVVTHPKSEETFKDNLIKCGVKINVGFSGKDFENVDADSYFDLSMYNFDNYDFRHKEECGDHCVITNADDLEYIYECIKKFGFSIRDAAKVATVSVLFTNISRAAATQIGRHRNAETWESQRYVDYSNAQFLDPASLVDKYDENKKYLFNFGNAKIESSLKDLGQMVINLYPQLLTHGFAKEDARSILPMNVEIGKLYMTFTFWSLFKFLELRTDKAAQAETRNYAIDIEHGICNFLLFNTGSSLYQKYIQADIPDESDDVEDLYSSIDEIIDSDF